MPSRRAEIALDDAEVHALLAQALTMVLVSNGPDGIPDPVPMWFVLDDAGVPVMRTWSKSQKVRNLQRDPRFSALVEDGTRYLELRGVQLSGRVELIEDVEAVLDVLMALAAKYEGADPAYVDAARESARAAATKQTVIRLVADRTVSWDHAKLATSAP